jgi:hypothetical protein
MLAKVSATRVMPMARVTVQVWVVRKRTAGRWVLVVLALLRIPVAAVAAIGVVGLLEIHHNLIALVLAAIPVVVAVLVIRRLRYLLCFTLKVLIREMARWSFHGRHHL